MSDQQDVWNGYHRYADQEQRRRIEWAKAMAPIEEQRTMISARAEAERITAQGRADEARLQAEAELIKVRAANFESERVHGALRVRAMLYVALGGALFLAGAIVLVLAI